MHEAPTPQRILIADDDEDIRTILNEILGDEGYEVALAPDGFKALGLLEERPFDVLITDVHMPMMDGLTLMARAREKRPDLDCVIMTAHKRVELAVEAMKAGAADFLLKPLDFDATLLVLDRVFEHRALREEVDSLRRRIAIPRMRLIGQSAPIRALIQLTEQVATSRATVLITGPSGTGKELVARMIHERSPRAPSPFVRLHCAALSETLLESELFGHEKGAFTGASLRRLGRFEEADGGTLFLDEIGEISASIQVKLLRFLQEREFERVGGNKTLSVDVRVVAATNRDLKREVREGRFREDLYYRLNVVHLRTPPLHTRREDIPLLARHFAARFGQENGKTIARIAPEALAILKTHDWPGNVRELENAIERAIVLVAGDTIEARHLPPDLGEDPLPSTHEIRIPGSSLADVERFVILKTLESVGGSTARTAEILDISVRKVRYKIKEYAEDTTHEG